MTRVDYYQDPNAPRANSLVVAGSAIVTDNDGRIVLHRRSDNALWALPGGGIEIGESVAEGIKREVREETGLNVTIDYVIAVYSDPDHVFAYDDGEVRQEFSVCVACSAIGPGTLKISDESTELGFFTPDEITKLEMHPRIRLRVTDFFAGIRAQLR
jgi:ADP-ribose pyrophosphatase YjhB (NUDIX family)